METYNRIPILKVDGSKILSWNAFHSYFQKKLGFPDFYGRNMNAWIDCMGDLDKPEHGMTTNFSVRKGEYLVVHLANIDELKVKAHDIYISLLECSAHINNRRISSGEPPLIFLAF
jgi:RNAse (barnase) inhibitor barstar